MLQSSFSTKTLQQQEAIIRVDPKRWDSIKQSFRNTTKAPRDEHVLICHFGVEPPIHYGSKGFILHVAVVFFLTSRQITSFRLLYQAASPVMTPKKWTMQQKEP
jgi:hypothetical protein